VSVFPGVQKRRRPWVPFANRWSTAMFETSMTLILWGRRLAGKVSKDSWKSPAKCKCHKL